MWPKTFDQRLAAWYQLRESVQSLPLDQTLALINQWWNHAPWTPYYLHWDDQPAWPDPWQLLNDNVYCDLARSLGILYTVNMLDRADTVDAELVLTEDARNLVLVAQRKYILNWSPEIVVNTNQEVKITKQYKQNTLL